MDVNNTAVTPGKHNTGIEFTGKELFDILKESSSVIDAANIVKPDLHYDYWVEPKIPAKNQLVVKDFTDRDIFAKAKSYATFNESNRNSDKVKKKCFDKFLSPVWQN